jgi:hypothetical protein
MNEKDKQEKLNKALIAMEEELVNKENNKSLKYKPSEEDIEYLKRLRNFSPTGLSNNDSFAVMATFPLEENIKMTNLHGPHWADKPGVLQDFMRKNPQYCIANSEGLEKFGRTLGKIEVKNA